MAFELPYGTEQTLRLFMKSDVLDSKKIPGHRKQLIELSSMQYVRESKSGSFYITTEGKCALNILLSNDANNNSDALTKHVPLLIAALSLIVSISAFAMTNIDKLSKSSLDGLVGTMRDFLFVIAATSLSISLFHLFPNLNRHKILYTIIVLIASFIFFYTTIPGILFGFIGGIASTVASAPAPLSSFIR